MDHPMLIDTETLQKQLGKPGLVVIDVRGDSAYEYGGHIPGAVHTRGTNIVILMPWPRGCWIPISSAWSRKCARSV